MSMRHPEARVRGLGSAHHGLAHWWAQRLTALALIPLALWFVGYLCVTVGLDFNAARASLHEPINAILMLCLIGAGLHHGQLGLQVVIEDYVHTGWLRLALIILVKFAAVLLGVACVFAVAKVAFA
jgi:succinate dehydrogenase / fumarate reductase membrane anchor subunit